MTVGDEGDDASTDAGSSDPPASADEPSDVFAVLADETRLAILRELADERRMNWRWAGKSFADLRRAVDERDAGNFSYHLDKLVGRFVVRDDDEYVVRDNGMELVGAVEAGRYVDPDAVTRRAETRWSCPAPSCERDLVARYEGTYLELSCPDHDSFQRAVVPPALVEHTTVDELVAVADDRTRHDLGLARRGVCPHCRGPMPATLPAPDPVTIAVGDPPDDGVYVAFECEQCGASLTVPPGLCLVEHPAVVSHYHDQGVDLRDRPVLTLPFVRATRPVVESTEPVRVRVDVAPGDDALSLWLDAEATVVDVNRS